MTWGMIYFSSQELFRSGLIVDAIVKTLSKDSTITLLAAPEKSYFAAMAWCHLVDWRGIGFAQERRE
jgi:hypothetical protein